MDRQGISELISDPIKNLVLIWLNYILDKSINLNKVKLNLTLFLFQIEYIYI